MSTQPIEPKAERDQGDLLASAIPALSYDADDLPWTSVEGWGRSSNTPPSAATPAMSNSSATSAVGSLPVVCDTVYVTFSAPTSEWARVACGLSEDRKHLPHWLTEVDGAMRVAHGEKGDPPPPDVYWVITRGTYEGFQAYRWKIEGVGPFHGVRLLVGDMPRAIAAFEPSLRNCLLQIGSAVLWMARGDGKNAAETVRSVLRALARDQLGVGLLGEVPNDDRVKPNRIDLCCDHWGYDWKPDDLRRFATRSRYTGEITSQARRDALDDGNRQQFGTEHPTFYLGTRGSETRQLRIYLKSAEAAESGKLPWLEPIWSQFGWKPGMRLWRAEVQFGGGWLRGHGMRTLADMENAERALWEHYTGEVRHTTGKATRKRRDGISDAWLALRGAATALADGRWRWTPRKPSNQRDAVRLSRQVVGCLDSIADLIIDSPANLQPSDTSNGAPWATPAPVTKAQRYRLAMEYVLAGIA